MKFVSAAALALIGCLVGSNSANTQGAAMKTTPRTRHCRHVIDQGDLIILACLQQNRPKISSGCDQVLKSHGP